MRDAPARRDAGNALAANAAASVMRAFDASCWWRRSSTDTRGGWDRATAAVAAPNAVSGPRSGDVAAVDSDSRRTRVSVASAACSRLRSAWSLAVSGKPPYLTSNHFVLQNGQALEYVGRCVCRKHSVHMLCGQHLHLLRPQE